MNGYYAVIMGTREGLIDLHIHSNFSDGAYSPTELINMSSQLGLDTVAIADHDSVGGISEAAAAALSHGINLIPAIEISVKYGGWHDVHLLGYGIDYTDSQFLSRLADFRDRRKSRNLAIIERVNLSLATQERPPISVEEVLDYAKDAIGRPHIARALLERGYVRSVEDAFQLYLIPCNIPKLYWPIDDAIKQIKRLGGIAVLAHPTSITSDRQTLVTILTELKQLGLDGIEVYNNMAFPQEMEFLRRRARELDLIATAGSDFHGIEPGLTIGQGRGGLELSKALVPGFFNKFQN